MSEKKNSEKLLRSDDKMNVIEAGKTYVITRTCYDDKHIE